MNQRGSLFENILNLNFYLVGTYFGLNFWVFEFTNLLILYWLDWLRGMVKSKAQKSYSVWGKGLTLSHSFLFICLFLFLFYCLTILFASWLFSFHDRLLELLSCLLFMGLCFWACMSVHASCMYMHTRNMHTHTLGMCMHTLCMCTHIRAHKPRFRVLVIFFVFFAFITCLASV